MEAGAREQGPTTPQRRPDVRGRSPERLEAFSDGVFAIAITLLILEIKMPQPGSEPGAVRLVDVLLGLWPAYFAYIFSFVMID